MPEITSKPPAGAAANASSVESENFAAAFDGDYNSIIMQIISQPPNTGTNIDTKLQKEQLGKLTPVKLQNYILAAMKDHLADDPSYRSGAWEGKMTEKRGLEGDFVAQALRAKGWPINDAFFKKIGWSTGYKMTTELSATIYSLMYAAGNEGGFVSKEGAIAFFKSVE